MISANDLILLLEWNLYQNSEPVRALLAYLRVKTSEMQTVDTIICSGLGPLQECHDSSQNLHRNFLRYAIALEIRDIFQEEHANKIEPTKTTEAGVASNSGQPRKIPVIVKDDMELSEACLDFLRDSLGMPIPHLDSVSLGMQLGAFVIGKEPMFDVNSIGLNKGTPVTGIAGMMCDPVDESKASESLAAWLADRKDWKLSWNDQRDLPGEIHADTAEVSGNMELWLSKYNED
ncbi:hypothetical protein NX059_012478 [Plenodomus lindquistii]|nr:hypothetical protein NX059_012478 [Plenodomus lindquistii]